MSLQAHARRERLLAYWLLRAYQLGHRPGTDPAQDHPTLIGIWQTLRHLSYNPIVPRAKRLLARKGRTRP